MQMAELQCSNRRLIRKKVEYKTSRLAGLHVLSENGRSVTIAAYLENRIYKRRNNVRWLAAFSTTERQNSIPFWARRDWSR